MGKLLTILLLLIPIQKSYAQKVLHRGLSLSENFATGRSYNYDEGDDYIAVFMKYQIIRSKYTFETDPGYTQGIGYHFFYKPIKVSPFRPAYSNSFYYYPNGMSHRFNLFFCASLNNYYYRTELYQTLFYRNGSITPFYRDSAISYTIYYYPRWHLVNILSAGFGFDIHFLKRFAFRVELKTGPEFRIDHSLRCSL